MKNRSQHFSAVKRGLCAAMAALAVAGIAVAQPAHAADPPAASQAFGSVDIQQILTGYTKKSGYDTQLGQLQQQLAGYLGTQKNYGMLSEADQNELGTLLALPAPTAAQTAEISALETQSTQATQQLTALQNNPNLSDSDKATMNQLLQQQTAGQKALSDVEAAYQAQIQAKSDALSKQLSQDVKAAIDKVAKEQGLSVVFDSQVAIYTTDDITPEVLKVLNK